MATSGVVMEGETIEVALTFAGETATASATFPAPYTIDSITGGFCNRTIMWSPTSTDHMTWEASSGSPMGNACPLGLPADRTIADSGTYTFAQCVVGTGPGCTTLVWLSRDRPGTQTGFAAGSSTRATQVRSLPP